MTADPQRTANAVLAFVIIAFGGTGFAEDEIASERRAVEKNPNQEYFLILPDAGRKPPAAGYKLLLVLPGGDGSAAFHPFVTRIGKHALGDGYVVAQLLAVKWTPGQVVVWPTDHLKAAGMEFSTEEFVAAVIADVKTKVEINDEHISTLSWSSGGPAAYVASLSVEEVRGSFVAMSVFRPDWLPALGKAKGHRYYIYHSPEDPICPFAMAERAKETLFKNGAAVEFESYKGGHGWRGNVFGAIRNGVGWLERR